MNEALIVVTKDGFKFNLKNTQMAHDTTLGVICFGKDYKELVVPVDNLSYFWIKEEEK